MSLGRPDLYINGTKMQTAKGDPRPALAGITIKWGGDNQYEYDKPSTLSGQLLIRGALPDYLHVGTEVGLIDPWSTRTLFAGSLQPLTAEPDASVPGAHRVSFTATSPVSELQEHTVAGVEYPIDESAAGRLERLRDALPAGWDLSGPAGWDWVRQGHQRFATVRWMDLAGRYFRGNLQRIHDMSVYIPGSGLVRRLTITPERPRGAALPNTPPGADGVWVDQAPAGASGTAILPASAVARDGLQWEKTPEDLVTAVQVTTWGGWLVPGVADDKESSEFEWPLNWALDNSANQRLYGLRLLRVETALSPQNVNATKAAVRAIGENWQESRTEWRPTTLTLPDSRRIATAPLLNLIAAHTRGRVAVSVPDSPSPLGKIRAFVLGGSATWDGKKWTTQLTLGRTQY